MKSAYLVQTMSNCFWRLSQNCCDSCCYFFSKKNTFFNFRGLVETQLSEKTIHFFRRRKNFRKSSTFFIQFYTRIFNLCTHFRTESEKLLHQDLWFSLQIFDYCDERVVAAQNVSLGRQFTHLVRNFVSSLMIHI